MPISRKRSASDRPGESLHMSGAKRRHLISANAAPSHSEEEILSQAAEILQARGNLAHPGLLEAIHSVTSTIQQPGEGRRPHLNGSNTGIQRRSHQSELSPQPVADNSHSSATLFSSGQLHSRNLLDLEYGIDEHLPNANEWITVPSQWANPDNLTTTVDLQGATSSSQQSRASDEQLNGSIRVGHLEDNLHGPPTLSANLGNESTAPHLDAFYHTLLHDSANGYQQSYPFSAAAEQYPALQNYIFLEEPARGARASNFPPHEAMHDVVPNANLELSNFGFDSWEDLGSSSDQLVSRSSSSGSLGWEQASLPSGQSSSDRSRSPVQVVLEQLVDLDVPSSGPLRQPGQRPHGRFESETLRQETCSTRKSGACLRCKMQHIRCLPDPEDPGGNCRTCNEFCRQSKQTIHHLPCLRYKLTESTLFRTGQLYVQPDLKWSNRWPAIKMTEITQWADTDLRRIKISQDLCPVPFEVTVRKFVPIKGDSLQRKWTDGKTRKSKDVPPYAIESMASTAIRLKKFVEENADSAISHLLADKDFLLKETYNMAKVFAKTAQVRTI
jgi:hypothetical protein